MVYDAARGETVLFGGGGAFIWGDTWVFNGRTWKKAAMSGPSARVSEDCLAYDAARQEVVLFGGNAAPGVLSDTWVWNGKMWARRQPKTIPPPRWGQAMAYDEQRRVVVMYGGKDARGGVVADTWEWDGNDWTRSVSTVAPPARWAHAMAYDAVLGGVLLFGGGDARITREYEDTWVYVRGLWSRLRPKQSPSKRCCHVMAYDSARRRVVLFAGGPASAPLGDTWEWTGANWLLRRPTGNPSARGGHAMAYDRRQLKVVVFGGNPCVNRFCGSNETWLYGPTSPASTVPFGTGCKGANGVLGLAAASSSLPWIGDSLQLETTSLGNTGAALLLGASKRQIGLGGIGMRGCTLYVGVVPHLVVSTRAQGKARWTIGIPNTPSLVGQSFHAQAFAIDRPANALGVIASNGLTATVGAK